MMAWVNRVAAQYLRARAASEILIPCDLHESRVADWVMYELGDIARILRRRGVDCSGLFVAHPTYRNPPTLDPYCAIDPSWAARRKRDYWSPKYGFECYDGSPAALPNVCIMGALYFVDCPQRLRAMRDMDIEFRAL